MPRGNPRTSTTTRYYPTRAGGMRKTQQKSAARRAPLRLFKSMKFKNPVHYFKRVVNSDNMNGFSIANGASTLSLNNGGFMTVSTNSVQSTQYSQLSLSYVLNDVPDPTEFTNLFDRYMITGIKMKLTPIYNQAQGTSSSFGNGNGSISGFIHLVVDYDDVANFAATEAGLDKMREYESYRTYPMVNGNNHSITKYIKPRIAVAASGSGVFTSYANQKCQWLDCNYPSVSHFGLKLMFQTFNPDASVNFVTFLMETTYYMCFKDLR